MRQDDPGATAGSRWMLLDDTTVALNEVLERCATCADLHEWAAEHATSGALRRASAVAGARRRAALERLCEDMRAHGARPHVPDPESTAFHAIVTGLKALLTRVGSDDARGEALARAIDDAERALRAKVGEALRLDVPDATRSRLESLAAESRAFEGR
jgi:hypothetical protein